MGPHIYALAYCDGFDKGKNIFMKHDGTIINKNAYESISPFDENGYAKVSENGDDYYLIDVDGETVSDKYSYTVYNLNTNTELTTIDSEPNFHDLFFTTTKGDKTQYYSCVNGKMFYEGATYY